MLLLLLQTRETSLNAPSPKLRTPKPSEAPQRLQNPLIKEYTLNLGFFKGFLKGIYKGIQEFTLNHIRDPIIVSGKFLN